MDGLTPVVCTLEAWSPDGVQHDTESEVITSPANLANYHIYPMYCKEAVVCQ